MGIADRDYMRERPSNEKNLFGATKPPRGPSVFAVVLIVVGVLYLVFKATQWWQDHTIDRAAAPVLQAQPVVALPAQGASGVYPQPLQRVTAPRHDAPLAAGTVTKCVRDGKTSYSDSPCPSGAVVSTLQPPPPAPVALPVRHVTAATPQVIAVQNPPLVLVQNQPAVNPFAHRLAECKALDTQITQLDNEARQLLSAQQQDWIKDMRKKARDRQFGLHCQ